MNIQLNHNIVIGINYFNDKKRIIPPHRLQHDCQTVEKKTITETNLEKLRCDNNIYNT